MKEITSQEFQQLLTSQEYLLIDFWAPWCGPCNTLGPVLEEIESKYSAKIKFCKMNVDKNDEVASQFKVVSIPNLCVFKNGQLVDRFVGFKGKKDIAKFLDKILKEN